MEHIIQAYGKAFISAAAILLLAAVLLTGISDGKGNRGVFQIAGSYLAARVHTSEEPKEFSVLDEENQKAAPRISFQQKDTIYVGRIRMMELIKAVDYQGKELLVRLLKLEKPNGEDMTGQYREEDGWIEMTTPGIYTMTVWALDEDNRKTVSSIRVPVNPIRRFS